MRTIARVIALGAPLVLALGLTPARTATRSCDVAVVTSGGTAVTPVSGAFGGYYVVNPLSAADQGLGAAEDLYVDAVGAAGVGGRGTTTALAPGQVFHGVPGSGNVSVNAASSGHFFTCVRW